VAGFGGFGTSRLELRRGALADRLGKSWLLGRCRKEKRTQLEFTD